MYQIFADTGADPGFVVGSGQKSAAQILLINIHTPHIFANPAWIR